MRGVSAAALGVPLTLLHAPLAGARPRPRAAITGALTWLMVARSAALAHRRDRHGGVGLLVPDPSMRFVLHSSFYRGNLGNPERPAHSTGCCFRALGHDSAPELVATTPMVWWWFGGVPLVGWLTNILDLPLGTWVLVPLAHLFVLTTRAPQAVLWAEPALAAAVDLLLSICDVFALLSFTRRLPPLDIAGIIVLVACVLLLRTRSWRRGIFILSAAAVLWLAADRALVIREQPPRSASDDLRRRRSGRRHARRSSRWPAGTGRHGPREASVSAARALRERLAARRRTADRLWPWPTAIPTTMGGSEECLEEFEIGELWLNGQLFVEERRRDDTGERRLRWPLAPKLRALPRDPPLR